MNKKYLDAKIVRPDCFGIRLNMRVDEVKRILTELGRRPVKLRGQHFLIDERVLADIITAAELKKTDLVLEIGPGLGILTGELLKYAGSVVAVELDPTLVSYLETTLRSNLKVRPQGLTSRLKLVEGDVLEMDLAFERYKVVSNIPYNITSAVLEKFLENEPRPDLMVLLVQREVAERIAAAPPHMNRLAVFVQYFGRPEIIRQVPRSAFWPMPRVDSAILRIRRYPDEVFRKREIMAPQKQFFRLLRAGFSAPRKKLVSNLEHELGLPRTEVREILQKAGIDPDIRAERIGLGEWLKLSRELFILTQNQ